MSVIPQRLRTLASEHGQALILFVGIFTIIAIAAAITIDFGLWFSERRGAQKDADLVALAGAYELLDAAAAYADVATATDASATGNGLDPTDDVHNLEVRSLEFPDGFEQDDSYCHDAEDTGARLNAVVLDVDHESRSLFAGLFGIAAPDIGAHACARAGSLYSGTGLKPWAISLHHPDCFADGAPQFGEDCYFRIDNVPLTGAVRLGTDEGDPCDSGSGANDYENNIVNGSGAVCAVGDLIRSETGNITAKTWDGVRDMIAGEGACDALNGNGDGIDQFDEAFSSAIGEPGPDEVFTPRNCVTPRAITIVVVEDAPTGPSNYQPIAGFAAFYVIRCETTGTGTVKEYEDCNIPNNERSSARLYGRFMRVLEYEGDIGDFDPFGTNVIRLVE
jgi:hypothetical protein